jgi:hypothetical protein
VIPPRLTGAAVRALMRKNRKTIRGVAQQYGLTQARVRHVRAHGVAGEAFVRDWLDIAGRSARRERQGNEMSLAVSLPHNR